jgi:hypothetical protein
MASSLASTEDIIATSRRTWATGDYFGAVNILEPMLPFSEPSGAIQAELIRVHLIHGNRKSALLVLAERKVAANPDAGLYHDLFSILEAFINVSVCGDLAGALQVATSMWQRHGTATAFEDGDEVLVSVH